MSELTASQVALEEQRLANDLFGNVGDNGVVEETRTEAQIEEEASLASGSVLFVDDRETVLPKKFLQRKSDLFRFGKMRMMLPSRLTLQAKNRLRKLQKADGETVISGKSSQSV